MQTRAISVISQCNFRQVLLASAKTVYFPSYDYCTLQRDLIVVFSDPLKSESSCSLIVACARCFFKRVCWISSVICMHVTVSRSLLPFPRRPPRPTRPFIFAFVRTVILAARPAPHARTKRMHWKLKSMPTGA